LLPQAWRGSVADRAAVAITCRLTDDTPQAVKENAEPTRAAGSPLAEFPLADAP
jgi:hypothetical protein